MRALFEVPIKTAAKSDASKSASARDADEADPLISKIPFHEWCSLLCSTRLPLWQKWLWISSHIGYCRVAPKFSDLHCVKGIEG